MSDRVSKSWAASSSPNKSSANHQSGKQSVPAGEVGTGTVSGGGKSRPREGTSCCPSAIKGPAILTGLGCCFTLLGCVPFIFTMVTHKNSATLIGLGFMGFGALLLVPGLCWCVVVYAQRRVYRPWKRRRFSRRSQEETPALRADDDQLMAWQWLWGCMDVRLKLCSRTRLKNCGPWLLGGCKKSWHNNVCLNFMYRSSLTLWSWPCIYYII